MITLSTSRRKYYNFNLKKAFAMMKNSQQIKDEIKLFILETSYASEDMLTNETQIFAQGIMDSLGFMSLVGFLDENFSIRIIDADLTETNFESIDAIGDFVNRKLNLNN
jgi:acyl carrier protein